MFKSHVNNFDLSSQLNGGLTGCTGLEWISKISNPTLSNYTRKNQEKWGGLKELNFLQIESLVQLLKRLELNFRCIAEYLLYALPPELTESYFEAFEKIKSGEKYKLILDQTNSNLKSLLDLTLKLTIAYVEINIDLSGDFSLIANQDVIKKITVPKLVCVTFVEDSTDLIGELPQGDVFCQILINIFYQNIWIDKEFVRLENFDGLFVCKDSTKEHLIELKLI